MIEPQKGGVDLFLWDSMGRAVIFALVVGPAYPIGFSVTFFSPIWCAADTAGDFLLKWVMRWVTLSLAHLSSAF